MGIFGRLDPDEIDPLIWTRVRIRQVAILDAEPNQPYPGERCCGDGDTRGVFDLSAGTDDGSGRTSDNDRAAIRGESIAHQGRHQGVVVLVVGGCEDDDQVGPKVLEPMGHLLGALRYGVGDKTAIGDP